MCLWSIDYENVNNFFFKLKNINKNWTYRIVEKFCSKKKKKKKKKKRIVEKKNWTYRIIFLRES